MTKRALIVSFFGFSSLLFGQLDSNTVTVTASASTTAQPDQVLFGVYVNSGLNTSLEDVLAALKSSGITMANFSGVTTNATQVVTPLPAQPAQPPQPSIQWAFGLPAPFAQMKTTVATLTALQQSIGQANTGLTLSFQVVGTQASAALLESQACNVIQLIANATTQAQKLAGAAGLVAGPILAMSGATSMPAVSDAVPSQAAFLATTALTAPQNCAVTVKFSLLKF